jgi:hypothetical protein
MSIAMELFNGDIVRRSGNGGGGNLRGEMEENLVGVEARDDGRWMDPLGVCSK